MIPDNDQPFAQIARQVEPGSTLLRSWQLSGGISAGMTALELRHANNQTSRVIVRQPNAGVLDRNPQAARHEFMLLQATKAAGLPTPTPYLVGESGLIVPTPYLVIEYIEGHVEFAPSDRVDFVQQLARQLANIHQLDRARYDVTCVPKSTTSLGERPTTVDHSLDEKLIRDRLEAVWPLQGRNRPTLTHGDLWPGNVLWHNARLVAIIDWEDASIGEPLRDLAISRLDLFWIFGADAMEAFTNCYRSLNTIDYTYLAYWDLYAVLRLIRMAGAQLTEWAAFFHPYGRHDITENSVRTRLHAFVAQALDTIDH